jgi:hypothetical protein
MPTWSLRILVVDDNRDAASTLGMLLRITGNDVRTAHDGEEAVVPRLGVIAGRLGDFCRRFFAAAVEPCRTPVFCALPSARDEPVFLPPRFAVLAMNRFLVL